MVYREEKHPLRSKAGPQNYCFFIFIDIVVGSGAITLSSNAPFYCLMSR